MAQNTNRIQTTHVGSLPRTARLQKANLARREGELPEADFQKILTEEVQALLPSKLKPVSILSTTANTATR